MCGPYLSHAFAFTFNRPLNTMGREVTHSIAEVGLPREDSAKLGFTMGGSPDGSPNTARGFLIKDTRRYPFELCLTSYIFGSNEAMYWSFGSDGSETPLKAMSCPML